MTEGDTEFRDLTELGELCGCTDKQIRMAEGLLAGLSQTEAAARAGYAGERDSVQLRSAASTAARSKPVMALLALAESHGLGVPNSPGDRDELRRILWTHARSKDKTHSIRAAVELERIEKEDFEAKNNLPRDPQDVLRELAEVWPEMADLTAAQFGMQFDAWAALTNEQKDSIRSCRATLAREWIKAHPAEARELLGAAILHDRPLRLSGPQEH